MNKDNQVYYKNMNEGYCIFEHSREECRFKKHTNIRYLICEKHLRDIYGLEISWRHVETPTEIIYVGFNLSVAPNTYFKENDVIIPVRRFFDATFRKEAQDTSLKLDTDKKYRMNPHLYAYILKKMKLGQLDLHDRYTYEMIRNLSQPIDSVDSNPIKHCENDPNHKVYLRQKMIISETFITENVLNTTFKTITYYDATADANVVEHEQTNLKDISTLFHYYLSKAEFSVHMIADHKDGNFTETNRLVPNAMFVKNIGLVATRPISNPSTIVVFGKVKGFDNNINAYDDAYNENIIVEPKEIVQPHSYQPQNLASNQVLMRKAMRTSCITNKR